MASPREIIERFTRIVEFEVARARPRLRFVTLDEDDLRSRGLEALVNGFALFQPDRGVSIEGWLHYYVRHRLVDAMRARAVQRREEGVVDIEKVVNGGNVEDLALALERRDAVLAGLPPRQYAIISAAIAGATVRETAASLGISVSRVHRERKAALVTIRRRWSAK